MVTVELLTIGTELVIGLTLNTNAQWLARRLTALGCHITRVVTVRDELGEIVDAIRDCIKRGVDVVITSGGLGPTEDDKTLKAVSMALNRKLTLNEEALKLVKACYKRLFEEGAIGTPELTPEREKMALLPEGSKPLENPVGAAPGVLVEAGEITVICLPGVPKELKAIFERHLETYFKRRTGNLFSKTLVIETSCNDESSLARILKDCSKIFPEAYIKSHAEKFGRMEGIPITVTVHGHTQQQVKAMLRKITNKICEKLRKKGYRCIKILDFQQID